MIRIYTKQYSKTYASLTVYLQWHPTRIIMVSHPPNADTSSEALAPSKNPSFTGSRLDFSEASGLSRKSDSEDEPKNSFFTHAYPSGGNSLSSYHQTNSLSVDYASHEDERAVTLPIKEISSVL